MNNLTNKVLKCIFVSSSFMRLRCFIQICFMLGIFHNGVYQYHYFGGSKWLINCSHIISVCFRYWHVLFNIMTQWLLILIIKTKKTKRCQFLLCKSTVKLFPCAFMQLQQQLSASPQILMEYAFSHGASDWKVSGKS